MSETTKRKLDREIVKRVLEYRRVIDTVLIGAKNDGTNRAIVVSGD